MIAEVIPLIRFPRSEGIFDFLVPKTLALRPGMIVRIPFGRRQLFGLVWQIKKTSSGSFKLKEILSHYEHFPTLPLPYLTAIKELSEQYFVSPALCAQMCIPDLLEKKKPNVATLAPLPKRQAKLKREVRTFIKKPGSKLILTQVPSPRSLVAQLIAGTIATGQHLILVPDMNRLYEVYDALPSQLKKSTVCIHGKLSTGALQEAWLAAMTMRSGIVLGTRRAALLPLARLKTIWLVDEDDPSHKQYDLNPRFDTSTVADTVSRLLSVDVIRTSASPLPATWLRFQKEKKAIISLGKFKPIAYITSERVGVLPPFLEQQIEEALRAGNRVFILTQQRGTATAVHCNQCGYIFRCPACQAVISRESRHTLVCKRCGTSLSEPKSCPRCHSTEFKDSGLTPHRVVERLRQTFPEASFSIVESTAQPKADAQISVGTEHIFSQRLHFDHVIVLSLEQLLSRPSFDAEFRAWQLLSRLRTIATTVTVLGQEESPSIISAANNNRWSLLYESVLKQRNDWHYPPAWQTVKLLYRATDQASVQTEARQVATIVKESLPSEVEIVGPFPRYPLKQAGSYRYAILVRWPNSTAAPDMRFFFNKRFDDWQVDINPLDAS